MTEKAKREFERRIDDYFHLCEKLLIRMLLFACFVYEMGKFIWFMIR